MNILWLILWNVFVFAIYGYDKYCAMADKWRISEKALLTFALLGGAFGAYAGMQIFRHKTKHRLFMIGVPVCMIINLAGFSYFGLI